MSAFNYYNMEAVKYDEKKLITDTEAETLFNWFKEKYKFEQVLMFRGTRQSGRCSIRRIKVCHNPSLHLLIHEIAHALQFQMYGRHSGKKFHTKHHTQLMDDLYEVYYKGNLYEGISNKEHLIITETIEHNTDNGIYIIEELENAHKIIKSDDDSER